MEKVGLVTPHYANNYGAQLQAFALLSTIKALGYDVCIINRRPPDGIHNGNCIKKSIYGLYNDRHCHGYRLFEDKYLQPQTTPFYCNQDLRTLSEKEFRAVVVGSDQIWRDDYFHSSFEYTPYLDFITNTSTLKISYAASFGKADCIHPSERKEIITCLLKKFNKISVREKSGVKILKDYYGVYGEWVADPTLLHDGKFYIDNLHLHTDSNKGKAVSYILGANNAVYNIINRVSAIFGVEVDHVLKQRFLSKILRKRPFNYIPDFSKVHTVIEWLEKLCSSDFVITDSFHGMVFSILFKRNFVVFDQVAGGSERYLSLLNLLGLSDRLVPYNTSIDEIVSKLTVTIDYDEVYKRLLPFRNQSLIFLREALKGNG